MRDAADDVAGAQTEFRCPADECGHNAATLMGRVDHIITTHDCSDIGDDVDVVARDSPMDFGVAVAWLRAEFRTVWEGYAQGCPYGCELIGMTHDEYFTHLKSEHNDRLAYLLDDD